jgi:hypothetical protein
MQAAVRATRSAPAAFRMYGEESPEYDYDPDDAPREQVERAALPARSRP